MKSMAPDRTGASATLVRMRRLLIATALVGLVVLTSAVPAGAHAEVRESDPPRDGTAPTGQDEVSITFITMDPEVPVEIDVLDPDGNSIVTGGPTVIETAATGTTVVVPVEPLEEGPHLVDWQAMSTDGDGLSTGTFEFTAEPSSGTGPGVWLLWLVVLAVPAAILLRPRRRQAGPQI